MTALYASLRFISRIFLRIVWICTGFAGLFFSSAFILLVFPAPAMFDPEEQRFFAQVSAIVGGPARLALMGGGLVLANIVLRRLLRRLRQSERDDLARQTLTQLRGGQAPPREFFLYLRAFETTGRLKQPLFVFDLAAFGLYSLLTTELESVVGAALQKIGPLVALGRPGENIGAGRISTSDEQWMSDIALLATHAKGILLIPSQHAGTLWEINYLHDRDLLSKTIFLMPPESRRFDWKSHWWEARRHMGALGSQLPEYQELGLLFTLGPDGAVRSAEPFSLRMLGSFRKSVLKLLAPGKPKVSITAAMMRAERRARRYRFWARLNFRARATAGVAYLLLAIVAVVHPPASSSVTLRSPHERMLNSPLYQARIRGLSAQQTAAVFTDLLRKGLRRLDGPSLVAYFSAFGKLLSAADERTCAAFATGNVTSEQLDRALAALSESDRSAFLDSQYAATLAELQQTRPPPASAEDLKQARDSFSATFTSEDLPRLNAINNASELSPGDACWLLRREFNAVTTLGEPYNRLWARSLAGK